MTGVALHGFNVAAGFDQLVSGTGVAQTMEHDLLKLRVLRTPCAVPFRKGFRGNRHTVGKAEELTTVAIPAIHGKLVLTELFQPSQQFLFQGSRQIKGAAGFLGFRLLQHQCGAAALTLVGENAVDLIRISLFQCSLFGAL